jgi:hypothetical protein
MLRLDEHHAKARQEFRAAHRAIFTEEEIDMKARIVAALAALTVSGSAAAVDFGVMESAEAIESRTFKLTGFPMLVDKSVHGDDAFALSLGYGLPNAMDFEVQVAVIDRATLLGADLEWNAWRADRMRFSIGGGWHGADLEQGASAIGADATAIFTYTPIARLDVNAALDAAIDNVNVNESAATPPPELNFTEDGRYDTYYFVPGVEYQVSRHLDVLAEAGLGLNGESDDYVSAGLAWYFR